MPPISFLRHLSNSIRLFSTPSSSLSLLQPIFSHKHDDEHKHLLKLHLEKRENSYFLLQSCSSTTQFLQIHAQFIKHLYIHHPRLSLKLLRKASLLFPFNLIYIRRIFKQISAPFISHYNIMIRVFSRSEFPDHGLVFYREMKKAGVVSEALTMSFCIKCCAKSLGLVEGLQIHGRVLVDGYDRDCVLMSSLIELYSVCGRCEDACKVFDEMSERDVVAYNVLISCFLTNKRTRDALAVFESMLKLENECRPDDVTCLLLLQACADLGSSDFGRRVGDYVERHGYGGSMNLNNALIRMYSKCGLVNEAYNIFERMPNKNLVTWTTLVSCFGINGYGKYALEAFWEMLRLGIAPDDKALTAVLYACSHSGLLKEGFEIFENMTREFGIQPNIHHYGCAVDILGRLGFLREAYDLINSMTVKPDAKVWRTLLAACRTFKEFYLAEKVVEHIVELKAQEAGDYVLLLNTYSSNAKWDKVRELRKFMKENKIMINPGLSTIELKGAVHEFVTDDFSHPRKDAIYETLHDILQQLKIAGYVPQILSDLHNLNAIEKETALYYHSEKLAIAFAVLSTPPGTTIRVANSLRTCVDCHDFAKVFSAAYNRRVIIRDRNRIHYFRQGNCSCDDHW